MARKTLHLFGYLTPAGGSSTYDEADYQEAQSRFFICDTRDDLPDNPGDMDLALTKDDSTLFFGNNGVWVQVKNKN